MNQLSEVCRKLRISPGVSIALGAGVGTALGAAFGNAGLGVAFGAVAGVLISAVVMIGCGKTRDPAQDDCRH